MIVSRLSIYSTVYHSDDLREFKVSKNVDRNDSNCLSFLYLPISNTEIIFLYFFNIFSYYNRF